MTPSSNTQSSIALTGRILLALIFILSGFGKLAAPGATIAYIGSTGLPLATVGYAAAVIVELGGGLALAFGWKTRIAATLLALFSIVAGLAFHHAIGDQNQMIHLLKNFAMAGGLLQVVAFGAGAFSIDHRRSATRNTRSTA